MAARELLYGIHPCALALRARSRSIYKAYLLNAAKSASIDAIHAACDAARIPVVRGTRDTLQRIAKSVTAHQGVLMEVSEPSLPSHLEPGPRSGAPGLSVLLEGVTDPHNVGAILRSAWLFGADSVLLPVKGSSGVTPTVSKTSSGALELWLASRRLMSVQHTPSLLEAYRRDGWRVMAAHVPDEEDAFKGGQRAAAGTNTLPLLSSDSLTRDVPTLLVLGSEGAGLKPATLAQCSHAVSVAHTPLPEQQQEEAVTTAAALPRLDSLNVSVAAAILLHALRARG